MTGPVPMDTFRVASLGVKHNDVFEYPKSPRFELRHDEATEVAVPVDVELQFPPSEITMPDTVDAREKKESANLIFSLICCTLVMWVTLLVFLYVDVK